MKKIKYFLLMAFSILLLSACTMKYETDVNIKADGSMQFAIVTGFDKEFITALMNAGSSFGSEDATEKKEAEDGEDIAAAATPTDSEIEEFFYSGFSSEESSTKEAENLGFKVEKYHEGDFYGYKYIADITHIDTVSQEEEVKFDISKIVDDQNTTKIQDQKMFRKQGNVYYATFTFDPSKQNLDSSSLAGENGADPETQAQLEQYMKQLGLEYKFVVTLPNEANDNNANEVSEDKKTLTWNLGTSQATDINFTFEIGKGSKPVVTPGSEGPNIPLVIGIAGGALLLVIIIFLITSKKKKGKVSKEESTETVGSVEAPVSPVEPTKDAAPAVESEPVNSEVSPTMPEVTPAEPVMSSPSESLMAVPSLETSEIVTPEQAPSVMDVPVMNAPTEEVQVSQASVEPVPTPEVEMPATEPVMPSAPNEPVASMVAPTEEVQASPVDTPNNN